MAQHSGDVAIWTEHHLYEHVRSHSGSSRFDRQSNIVQYSDLSRVSMLASRDLSLETAMDAFQFEKEEVQAANKQSKRFIWKMLASISIAVCLVTVLRLATAPRPQHPANSNRRLSAPSGPSENVSSPTYLSGNISESIPAANTLCVCNPTATRVFLATPITASFTVSTAWVSSSRPCACSSSENFATYGREGQLLSCWYVVDKVALSSQCQGGRFYYSRYSNLAGRYVCSGSPPVCRYSGFCRQPSCLRYP